MATVSFVKTEHAGNSVKHTWLNLTTTNADGDPMEIPGASDRCVQMTGTLGTGGAVTIQGSNDGGTTWATLTDFQDADLVLTALGMHMIAEAPLLIRPFISAGDGSTDLNIYIFSRGTR